MEYIELTAPPMVMHNNGNVGDMARGLSQSPNFPPWSNINLYEVYVLCIIYTSSQHPVFLCSVEPVDFERTKTVDNCSCINFRVLAAKRNPVYDQFSEGPRKHEIQDGCPFTFRQK